MLPNTPATGYKIFALSMLTMAVSDVIAGVLVKTGFSSPLLNVFRYTFLTIFPLLIAIYNSQAKEIFQAKHKKLLLIRGACNSLAAIFYFASFIYIPFSMAASIFFCAPIAILAFSPWVLGERVTIRQWFTVLLGFAGMFMIINPFTIDFSSVASKDSLIGFAFALLAMFSFMVVQLLTKKSIKDVSSLSILFWGNLIAVFVSFIFSFIFQSDFSYVNTSNILSVLAISFLAFFAQLFLIIPFKYVKATDLAPLNYLQLAISVIIAIIFLGERPPMLAFIGMVFIFCAGTLQGFFASRGIE